MALEDFFEPVAVQNWVSKPNGFGGVIWGFEDGAIIDIGFIMDQSMEARIAEAQGVKSMFTVVARPNAGLEYQDVVRRIHDNALYRITSAFNVSPDVMEEPMMQASAEKVDSE